MQTLEYAPRSQTLRRKCRLAVIAACFVILLPVMWHFHEFVIERYRLFQLRRAANMFNEAPGTVVYEEDPSEATKLLVSGKYQRVPYAGTFAGTDWNPVVRALPKPLDLLNSVASVACFLHQRTLPGGQKRIVLVGLQNENHEELGQGRVLTFYANALDLRAGEIVAEMGTKLQIPGLAPGDRVRVLAGQADPNDRSAFSIEFQINGKKQVLRGRITDNEGNIELMSDP